MKKLLLAPPAASATNVEQLLKGVGMAYARRQYRLIALAVLVVVAAATACCAASSRPFQTASAPLAGKRYVSKRYGYEIVLTGKYTMVQAQLRWDGSFPFGASGKVDLILDDTQDRKFIVAAKLVPARMSLRRWEAFIEGVKRQSCGGLRHFRSSSLGGVPAREFVNSCPGYEVITLSALHKRRGYLLEYLAAPSLSRAANRRIYDAGRRAFAFTQN